MNSLTLQSNEGYQIEVYPSLYHRWQLTLRHVQPTLPTETRYENGRVVSSGTTADAGLVHYFSTTPLATYYTTREPGLFDADESRGFQRWWGYRSAQQLGRILSRCGFTGEQRRQVFKLFRSGEVARVR